MDACGFDGDCDGQMPPPCGVQVLVDTPQPWFLALDPAGDYLFWSKRSFNSPGGIYRVKKDGTDYALLYPNEFDPRGIAADANEIFWTVEDGLRAGPKDGSGASYRYMMPAMFSPEWIALLNDPCPGAFLAAVAVDDTHAYWTVMGDSFCNAVLRVDKTTGAPAVGFLTGILPGAGIALDPADVFFTRGPRRMTKSGAGLTTLSNDDFLEGIAVDAGHVYVKGVTSLVRMEKDGNNPTALASWASCGPGGHYPFNVAVDDTHVYWLDQCGMTVRRVEKSGANETVIGAGAGCLMSIVVDDAAAYWSECLEAGRIMKWTKP
ncbi:MAG: hypothetical protein IT372_25640 [Polyangiaceae bacterium]|nr:hypothetical protein [Polyangiaceae bacterium]